MSAGSVPTSLGDTAMGTFNLAVTITPNGDEDTSGDADDQHDEHGEIEAGCNAGGGSSLFVLFAPRCSCSAAAAC